VADQSAYDKLASSHEELSDDELAERVAAHPDRDVLLALWRRVRGEKTPVWPMTPVPPAEPAPPLTST
jgi:hypothetical protein